MIRVIYRWQVSPEAQSAFRRSWHDATLAIRRDQPGALGSTLLGSQDDTSGFAAVARWRTRADLEAFWAAAPAQNVPGVELTGVEIFDELDHLDLGPSLL